MPGSVQPVLGPSDWSAPKRYRGKLVATRVRHFPEKIIALTFDDGPSSNLTPRILDTLKAHGARATFFVLGKAAKRHPDLLKRMLAEGNAIGNHTYSHGKGLSSFKAAQEIDKTADVIRQVTGRSPCCFRPPYGITTGNLAHVAEKDGYPVITWTISTADTTHIGADVIAQNVLHTPNPGAIVLMHDSGEHGATADAVPDMLDKLTAMGYKCVTIPELLRAWDKWQSGQVKHPTSTAQHSTSK